MQYEKPLVTITDIFPNPRELRAQTEKGDYRQLAEAVRGIDYIQDSVRAGMGFKPSSEVEPMALDTRYGPGTRSRVQAGMKARGDWKDLCYKIINHGRESDKSVDDQMDAIYLPDWNRAVADLNGISTRSTSMYVDATFGISHTFLSQLKRRDMLRDNLSHVSVYGYTTTSDGKVMLGRRCGMSYPGGMMTMPAGSLYAIERGGTLVIDGHEGMLKEIRDETGLENDFLDFSVKGVIGIFEDPTVTGFVYEVWATKTEDELRQIWTTSGNKEHDSLHFLPESEAHEYIEKNLDRRPRIEPVVDPEHPLLPSGAAVLLIGMAKKSPQDFKGTVRSLGGMYRWEHFAAW